MLYDFSLSSFCVSLSHHYLNGYLVLTLLYLHKVKKIQADIWDIDHVFKSILLASWDFSDTKFANECALTFMSCYWNFNFLAFLLNCRRLWENMEWTFTGSLLGPPQFRIYKELDKQTRKTRTTWTLNMCFYLLSIYLPWIAHSKSMASSNTNGTYLVSWFPTWASSPSVCCICCVQSRN